MFKIDEGLMLPAHVVCPKVDRRAVGGRGVHDIDHDLGDVNFLSPWEWFSHLFFVIVLRDSSGVVFFLFFKKGSNSVLSPELLPCLSG